MKKFICLFFILLMPMVANAAASHVYNQEARAIAQRFKDELYNGEYVSDDEFARLEKFNVTDRKNWILYTTGEQFFSKMKDEFLAEMEQKSKETGRELKSATEYWEGSGDDKKYVWWLDRGELDDKDKCEMDKMHPRRACPYPDGFEEFKLEVIQYQLNDYKVKKELYYTKENKDKNLRNFIEIIISTSEDTSSPEENHYMNQTYVEISGHE